MRNLQRQRIKKKTLADKRKRKQKKYIASTESESEDDKVKIFEMEKLAKGISSNTDAVNNLSTSVMRILNGFKTDHESVDKISEENMKCVGSLTQDTYQTGRQVEILLESKEMSNKIVKIESE